MELWNVKINPRHWRHYWGAYWNSFPGRIKWLYFIFSQTYIMGPLPHQSTTWVMKWRIWDRIFKAILQICYLLTILFIYTQMFLIVTADKCLCGNLKYNVITSLVLTLLDMLSWYNPCTQLVTWQPSRVLYSNHTTSEKLLVVWLLSNGELRRNCLKIYLYGG